MKQDETEVQWHLKVYIYSSIIFLSHDAMKMKSFLTFLQNGRALGAKGLH